MQLATHGALFPVCSVCVGVGLGRVMGRVTQSTLAGGPAALPAAMLLSSSSPTPLSLHAWFRTELEKLGFGIDAGFYTHHTLDILRQTDLDLREEYLPPRNKQVRRRHRKAWPSGVVRA
jgi:hypothetical protein